MKSQKIAYLGVSAALAILLGYLELLIPAPTGIPGVKLGLANLVTISLLYRYGIREASVVSLVRILVNGFLFGSLFGIFYSLAGAAVSLFTMWTLKHSAKFSMTGVSVAGGISHNIGQLFLAVFIVHTKSLLYYAPALLVSGVLAGLVIGLLGSLLAKRVIKADLS